MITSKKKFSVLLVLMLLLVACSTLVTDGYRTLAISNQTYDVTLFTMGDLYKAGKLTDAQRDKAIEIGRAYKIAHNGAVESLAKYEETNRDSDKVAYEAAAVLAAKRLSEFIAYCTPFLPKKEVK